MSALPTPELRFFAELSVQVGTPIEVGQTIHGLRRVIPILGGTVQGQGWTARVLPGGADFQLIVKSRMAELDARYVIETDGGDLVYVTNRAVRTASPEVMTKLVRGELLIRRRCTSALASASRPLPRPWAGSARASLSARAPGIQAKS